MLMYISKKYKVTHQHFFSIFDVGGNKLKNSLLCILFILFQAIFYPVPIDYLQGLREGYLALSIDSLFDYTIPLVAALTICYTFFGDYKNKRYELLAFYNHATFNYMMLYRWGFFVLLFCLSSFISGLFYYRNVSFLDVTNLLFSIRFIPNILFLCALVLCVTVLTKNGYAGLLVMLTYFMLDMLSSARLFKVLSLGTNANNWFYTATPEYYFMNRFSLVIVSIILVYIACKRSVRA